MRVSKITSRHTSPSYWPKNPLSPANIWLLCVECKLSGFTPALINPAAVTGIYRLWLVLAVM